MKTNIVQIYHLVSKSDMELIVAMLSGAGYPQLAGEIKGRLATPNIDASGNPVAFKDTDDCQERDRNSALMCGLLGMSCAMFTTRTFGRLDPKIRCPYYNKKVAGGKK